MEMKWNPIVNGDLSEVPREEDVLFTAVDEDTGEFYTTVGEVDDFFIEQGGCIFAGKKICSPVSIESLIAWMKLPEPFMPGRCDMCEHSEHGIDNFGDYWSKCKLLDNVPFSKIISLKGCPTEKEVD